MSKIKQAIGITLFESDDFGGPKVVRGGGICPTQRAEKVCCGVIEVMETEKKIGNIFGFTGGNYAGNVYDKDHLSPTLNTMQGGYKQPMIVENPKELGFMDNGTGKHQSNTVYDENALCPNITTIQGGGTQQIKILSANSIRMVRTEQGKALRKQYENHEIHHGFNEHREPELRQDGVTNTLSTVQKDNYICVAMRGRNPTNPSDRTPCIEIEQRLEPNTQGTSNCLTSVQKDNLVLENVYDFYNNNLKSDGVCGTLTTGTAHNGSGSFGVVEGITTKGKHIDVASTILSGYERTNMTGFNADNGVVETINKVGQISNDGSQYGTVIADNGLSPNLVAGTHGYANNCIQTQYRIRKLTPRECWRLMDFSDEDFEKAAEVNSNTQLYKQAGNSIVVNVLVAILGQLLPGKENVYKELSE